MPSCDELYSQSVSPINASFLQLLLSGIVTGMTALTITAGHAGRVEGTNTPCALDAGHCTGPSYR